MMEFPEATRTCLKKWCTFSGRATRAEYWWFLLFYYIAAIVLNIGIAVVSALIPAFKEYIIILLLFVVLLLGILVAIFWLFIAFISVFVRRMHDVGHSGWWYWIAFTIVGAIFPLFIWQLTKGTEGDNRYGPDPLKKVLA